MNKIIQNACNETLDYSFASGTAAAKREEWIVILGHGVTGNKDRPVIVDTASTLNAAGFDTLRFSFAGNGDSGGRFEEATITKEVGDLASVIDAISDLYPKIAYIGHSMGGAVGVLLAAKDHRINALFSLAGMVDTKSFAETEFGEERPDEGCMWGEAACPLSSKFMNDLCRTIGSVEPSARAINIPWLLIHGTADDIVLPRDTERIQAIKGNAVDLMMIPEAGHSFDHPDHKAAMTQTVLKWLSGQV